MRTELISASATGTVTATADRLAREVRARLGDRRPAFLVTFASTSQPLTELVPKLVAEFPGVPLLGSSSAGEFTERGGASGAAVLLAVTGDYRVFSSIGTGLKANPERAVAEALHGLPRSLEGYPHCTGILLVDGMAGNGEEATLLAAALLDGEVRFAGGMAGDDFNMQLTHLACGSRVEPDAVVAAMLFSKHPLGVGVRHGHKALTGPLQITRSRGNVVYEINRRNAWEVWCEATRERAARDGIDVSSNDRIQQTRLLVLYEAGLAAGSDLKIRVPLSKNPDGSLNFGCGMPEGTVFRITESDAEGQVSSARMAARLAAEQLGGLPPAGALVFDCSCRRLILQDDFGRAVRGISEELGGTPLVGFETYGEIALNVGEMSGFHNTTSVVVAFPAD